jgi:hypothetical protein
MSTNYKATNYGKDTQDSGGSYSINSTTSDKNSSGDKSSSGNDKIRNFSQSNKDSRADGMEELSSQMASRVRSNPWAFVGGASIAALAIGYFMGCRRAS